MKKWSVWPGILIIVILVLITSCASFDTIIPKGKWRSSSPDIYIETIVGGGTAVSGMIGANGNIGELTNDDGTVTEIYFHALNGRFSIYKLRDDAMYEEEDKIMKGTYRFKNDTLILTTEDDEKIVLKRVDTEESES